MKFRDLLEESKYKVTIKKDENNNLIVYPRNTMLDAEDKFDEFLDDYDVENNQITIKFLPDMDKKTVQQITNYFKKY